MTDQASKLQKELEKHAPDIEWSVTELEPPRDGVKIAWEKEVDGRRLSAESELEIPPEAWNTQVNWRELANQIAGNISRIQPTGEDSDPRLAYFIQETHKAPGGGYIVCVAREGVKGCVITGWNYGADVDNAQAAVDGLNKRLGLTRTEAFQIVSGAVEK